MKAIAILLFAAGVAVGGLTNETVRTVLVRMTCVCGGEMKPTGQAYATNPPGYIHACDRCKTNAVYSVTYPLIQYETVK